MDIECVILSWDVGIITLSYCVLACRKLSNSEFNIEIYDWDKINLIENGTDDLACQGRMKNGDACQQKAKYLQKTPKSIPHGWCQRHLSQYSNLWSERHTERLFRAKVGHSCCYQNRKDKICGKSSAYQYGKKYYLCRTHYRLELAKKIRLFSPMKIKKNNSNNYSTAEIQFNLVKKLDELVEHFAKLGVTEVVIENQPSQKNPRMKSIASTLYHYYLIRGRFDQGCALNISHIAFICPSNKLKLDESHKLILATKSDKKKYKLTKSLSVKYTRRALSDTPHLQHLDLYHKQDDLCDCYLQGCYYLKFIRKWN